MEHENEIYANETKTSPKESCFPVAEIPLQNLVEEANQ